jgi:hypothetical protein
MWANTAARAQTEHIVLGRADGRRRRGHLRHVVAVTHNDDPYSLAGTRMLGIDHAP